MLGEERLGRPLDEAIAAMCERIGSPDLEYVATAVKVQSQTGGSLAGLFDTLSETVRERQRHARKVQGADRASAACRRSSLVSLPIGLGGADDSAQPLVHGAAVHDLERPHRDRRLPAMSMAIGSLLLKRIVSVRY